MYNARRFNIDLGPYPTLVRIDAIAASWMPSPPPRRRRSRMPIRRRNSAKTWHDNRRHRDQRMPTEPPL
jgi:hypothetical protein